MPHSVDGSNTGFAFAVSFRLNRFWERASDVFLSEASI